MLTKSGISRQIFIKVPNIKLHENSSSGSRAHACGQTDANCEANRRFMRLSERAYVLLVLEGRPSSFLPATLLATEITI